MIVGISGRRGSGKSTLARYLNERIEDSVRIPIAFHLKQLAQECFGAMPVQVYGTDSEKASVVHVCGMSGREILQRVGHGMRQIWPDCWVFSWEREVVRVWAERGYAIPVIADDVRYRNEAEKIREMGGIVIRLERRPISDGHASERELDEFAGWDCVIPDGADEYEAGIMAWNACLEAGIV